MLKLRGKHKMDSFAFWKVNVAESKIVQYIQNVLQGYLFLDYFSVGKIKIKTLLKVLSRLKFKVYP
jgi:hypothetical protein